METGRHDRRTSLRLSVLSRRIGSDPGNPDLFAHFQVICYLRVSLADLSCPLNCQQGWSSLLGLSNVQPAVRTPNSPLVCTFHVIRPSWKCVSSANQPTHTHTPSARGFPVAIFEDFILELPVRPVRVQRLYDLQPTP